LRPGVRGAFGVAVCSEDTVSSIFRAYAAAGAGWAVVLLNDGWFHESRALVLHAQNAVLRAVEDRRPVVRVANTGWTCLIDASGRVTGPVVAPRSRGGAVVAVTPSAIRAPYTFIGDSFCIFLFGFVIIIRLRWCVQSTRGVK
jgi:apolipoprotein N-acyltransferase